jgi:hypothetical protein
LSTLDTAPVGRALGITDHAEPSQRSVNTPMTSFALYAPTAMQ